MDRRLQAMADAARDADMPRVWTGHFSVTGAVWAASVRDVGARRSVLLSTVSDPAWDCRARPSTSTKTSRWAGPTRRLRFSGSMERIDFGERRPEVGFVWVELTRGAARYEFVPVDWHLHDAGDVRRAGNPTGAVLEEIARHDLRDAVVRVVIKADPEADLLIQDRPIQQALYDAGVNHIAAIQRDVERPARMRLGTSPEGFTPEQLLERYLRTRRSRRSAFKRCSSTRGASSTAAVTSPAGVHSCHKMSGMGR